MDEDEVESLHERLVSFQDPEFDFDIPAPQIPSAASVRDTLMNGSVPIPLPPAVDIFPFADPIAQDAPTGLIRYRCYEKERHGHPSYYVYLAALSRPGLTSAHLDCGTDYISSSTKRHLFQWAVWIERDPPEYDFPAKHNRRKQGYLYRYVENTSQRFFTWDKDFSTYSYYPSEMMGTTLVGALDSDRMSTQHVNRLLNSIDPPRKGVSGTETAEYYTWATHALTCLRAVGVTCFHSTPVHVIVEWAEDRALMAWYPSWKQGQDMLQEENPWTAIKIPVSGRLKFRVIDHLHKVLSSSPEESAVASVLQESGTSWTLPMAKTRARRPRPLK